MLLAVISCMQITELSRHDPVLILNTLNTGSTSVKILNQVNNSSTTKIKNLPEDAIIKALKERCFLEGI